MESNFVLNNLIYITNPFDEDYEASWNGNSYLLESQKMTPVVIGEPLQNQNIRKIWALALCERELGKVKKFQKQAFTDQDLIPLMAKCLAPLEKVEPKMKPKEETPFVKAEKARIERVLKIADPVTGEILK